MPALVISATFWHSKEKTNMCLVSPGYQREISWLLAIHLDMFRYVVCLSQFTFIFFPFKWIYSKYCIMQNHKVSLYYTGWRNNSTCFRWLMVLSFDPTAVTICMFAIMIVLHFCLQICAFVIAFILGKLSCVKQMFPTSGKNHCMVCISLPNLKLHKRVSNKHGDEMSLSSNVIGYSEICT